ncbi:lactonase family protein [Pseudomonas sp. RIT-PI-S]|uniref:lactonase family protein n=1 Tax=Pseudomonas sp. RIT-PI-S TaxID=3035295 RepID=UPI0021D892AC|nr:lactonase family protein [Pseudomonas sp. RIT-PI-S]
MSYAYISSPNDGLVSHYHLNDDTGELRLVEQLLAGEKVNALALSPDGSTLYAALRGQPPQVASFSVDAGNGKLTRRAEAPLGAGLSYMATDRQGRFLLGASYGEDLVTLQPVDDELQVLETIRKYPSGLHAHSVRTDPSNRFVYACVLGVDRVLQYRLDEQAGELQPIGKGFIAVPENTGPRHLAFSEDGKYVFVVGEMSGTVTSFAIDSQTGELSQVDAQQGIPASLNLEQGLVRDSRNNNLSDDPTPRIWCADIRLVPGRSLLYITERTTSSVSVFEITAAGTLNYLGNHRLEEKQPRNIAISPSGEWLLACGEQSAVVGAYRIQPDGRLARVSQAVSGDGALWIEVLPEG